MKSDKPLARKFKIPYPDAFIDIDNANLYCAKCDQTYTRKSNFITNLADKHSIIVERKASLVSNDSSKLATQTSDEKPNPQHHEPFAAVSNPVVQDEKKKPTTA